MSLSYSPNLRDTNVIMGDEYVTIYGDPYLEDSIRLPDGEKIGFRISPLSFYQVNPGQMEKLYAGALEFAELSGNETVWDLYCGIGTISLFLAKKAGYVYGVEIVPQAIEDARENALRNGIANAEFFTGKAEEVLPRWYEEHAADKDRGARPDVMVVDPPRKGCDEACLETMVKMQPRRIVYVSCNPATLARDLRYLCSQGYRLTRVRPYDLFPQSVHVETVMLLVQQRPDDVVRVGIDTDELGVTKAESKATYGEIQARVKAQTGLNVTPLYIAQVKRKHGIIERECYNKAKADSPKMHLCPSDKEAAIEEALRFFGMIA